MKKNFTKIGQHCLVLLMTIVGMMASVGVKAQLNGEVVDMRRGCIHHSSHTRANDSYTLLPSPYKFDLDKIYCVPVGCPGGLLQPYI